MNERWMLAIALLAVSLLGLWLLRRQSPLSLPVLVLGVGLPIGCFYPLLSLYVEPRSWRNLADISEPSLLGAQLEYLAFALGLVAAIGVLWALDRGALGAPCEAAEPSRFVRFRDGVVAWGLVAVGALLYAGYVAQVGLDTLLSTEDFAGKYLESRGLGLLAFGINLAIAGALWGEAGELRRASLRALRLVALLIFLWAFFFIAVRTYAVALVIGYLAIFCTRRRVQLRRIRPRVVLMILAAYFAVEGYAIVRSSWMSSGDFLQAVELARDLGSDDALGGVVGGSELSHPFITTAELLQHEEGGTLLGESYADALLAFVPLFLLPERPTTLAQDFVAEYYPALEARGGGSSFSLVAEAWWNFGPLFGPWLIGLALGSLLLFATAHARRRPHGIAQRLLPYLAFLCVLIHRGQAQATFKQVVSLLLPVLALVLVARAMWTLLARPRRRASSRRENSRLPLGVH